MKFELPDVSELPDDCEWEVEAGEVPVLLRGHDGSAREGHRLWWDGSIHESDEAPRCSCWDSAPCSSCTSRWSDEAEAMVEEVGRAFFAAGEAQADAEAAQAAADAVEFATPPAPLTVEQCARIALAAAESRGMTVAGFLHQLEAARALVALADSVGVLPGTAGGVR